MQLFAAAFSSKGTASVRADQWSCVAVWRNTAFWDKSCSTQLELLSNLTEQFAFPLNNPQWVCKLSLHQGHET